MPAEGIHLTALREAMASPALAVSARRRLVRRDDAARFGALVPDLAYFDRYVAEVIRYVARVPARPSHWGSAIHDGGAVALLGSLLGIARRERDPDLAAIALGLASHCAIDRALHPLINALARAYPTGRSHDASHREVEKFQSVCFHEHYLGRDTMGTPAITGYLSIQLADGLDDRIDRLLREAWADAMGSAPDRRELAGFVRGYRAHSRLLGTRLGKRIAPPAAKDEARPRFLRGAWGTFEALLEAAIAVSLGVIEAADAVLDAGTSDLDRARQALADKLPLGTIDPQGTELDLERPVQIAAAAAALDDDGLWRAFHDRTLPAAQWTHAAHLRIAWLHLARYEIDEAHLLMRIGIVRLNATHGLVETAQRGYHETLTRVWLLLVRATRNRGSAADSTQLPADPTLDRSAPLRYYSRDRLFSLAARAAFIPPDLGELP